MTKRALQQKTALQQIEEKGYARLPKGCRQGLGMAQTGLGITVSALLSLINVQVYIHVFSLNIFR